MRDMVSTTSRRTRGAAGCARRIVVRKGRENYLCQPKMLYAGEPHGVQS